MVNFRITRLLHGQPESARSGQVVRFFHYRLDEYLDLFESELEPPAESENGSVGTLRWSGAQQYPGFELSYEDKLVHLAGFNGE